MASSLDKYRIQIHESIFLLAHLQATFHNVQNWNNLGDSSGLRSHYDEDKTATTSEKLIEDHNS